MSLSELFPEYINGTKIARSTNAKYLGRIFVAKMKWQKHVKQKITASQIKYNYGIIRWGCTSDLIIKIRQIYQNKMLRNVVSAT